MKNLKLTAVILAMVFLSSCFKEDKPVVLPPAGDAKVYSVAIGEDYATQVYFKLNTGETHSNLFAEWDLAFESSVAGYHCWMNGGNGAFIANSGQTDFNTLTDTAGLHWMYDAASWNKDSTAIGEYLISGASSPSKGEVYVIDRGISFANDTRFKKFIITSENDAQYFIRYAALDGSFEDSIHINKNPAYSYLYFTFSNGGGQLNFEPLKINWDILFTRYRYIYYNMQPPFPYEVNGVLLNNGTGVAMDSIANFNDVDLTLALQKSYSTRRDMIGFSWKYYDFASASYITKPKYTYLIHDLDGVYWKFHFIDFYNDQGIKGYPKFEIKRL